MTGGGRGKGINNFGGTQKFCFLEFESKDKKKNGLYHRICEKSVLAHGFWIDGQYFESLRPRTVLQWLRTCYYLWGTILALGGTILVWGAQAVIWGGTASECSPRGTGPVNAYLAIIFEVSDPKLRSDYRSIKN